MQFIHQYKHYFAPAGRILVGAFFFLAGVGKFMDIAGTAGYIESVGLPMGTLLAWLAAIFLVVVAGAFMAGYKPKEAAFLLVLFTVFVTFMFHGPNAWSVDESGMQMLMFMKNMAIVGGLLFMMAYAGQSDRETVGSAPRPTL